MVKYGKEFRKKQKPEWKDKYLDYKMLKQLIKSLINPKKNEQNDSQNNNINNLNEDEVIKVNDLELMLNKEISENSPKLENANNIFNLNINTDNNEKPEEIDHSSKKLITTRVNTFSETLDKEIKKFFLFFVKEEKQLYKDINMHLYGKEEYEYLGLDEFAKEFEELLKISQNSLELTKFVFYNFKGLMKILKKFDKKAFDNKTAKYKITERYIQLKLEEQNSDILYILNFKMIDEVGALLEDLIGILKRAYDSNKQSVKEEYQENIDEENEKKQNDKNVNNNKNEKLIADNDEDDDISAKIKNFENIINNGYTEINKNLRETDKKIADIRTLFQRWEKFIKISSDIGSKLYALTKESAGNTVKTVHNNRRDKKKNKKKKESKLEKINELNESLLDGEYDTNITLLAESSQMPTLYNINSSILSNVTFSRENRSNIRVTLLHTFLFMYSYSVTIPLVAKYSLDIIKSETYIVPERLNTFINMGLPLGILLSFTFSTKISRKSTKKPLILSTFLILFGNLLYLFAEKMQNCIPMLVGRILIGLGGNRVGNKIYLVNYVPKQCLNNYLAYFHFYTVMGLTLGYLFNCIFVKVKKDSFLNYKTLGPFTASVFSFVLLLIELLRTKEAFNNPKFKSTDITLEGHSDTIERDELGIGKSDNKKKGEEEKKTETVSMTVRESIQKDTLMVENTNYELEKFNIQNQFDDTNLVAKSIDELTTEAKEKLKFLKTSFIVFLFIVFTSKMMTELILIISPVYVQRIVAKKENDDITDKNTDNKLSQKESSIYLTFSLIVGITQIINLILEYFYNLIVTKGKCIKEKVYLFVFLFLCFIGNIIELILHNCNNNYKLIAYFFYMAVLMIFANFLEKISNSFFGKIFPLEYKAGCLQGNIVLNIFCNLGKIIGAFLPFILTISKEPNEVYCKIVFAIISFFTLICLVLLSLFYADIRVKAISRILGKEMTKETEMNIKITNEL